MPREWIEDDRPMSWPMRIAVCALGIVQYLGYLWNLWFLVNWFRG